MFANNKEEEEEEERDKEMEKILQRNAEIEPDPVIEENPLPDP